jgi:hypothetical protein
LLSRCLRRLIKADSKAEREVTGVLSPNAGLGFWVRDANDEVWKLPLYCETHESAGWMHVVRNAGLKRPDLQRTSEIRP